MNVLDCFHFLLVAAVMPLIHWVCNIGKVYFFDLTALNSTLNPSKSFGCAFVALSLVGTLK